MKPFKLLFAAIAVMITGMLNTASAADIYTPPTPDEVLVANDGVDWTGFYAGLVAGYGWGNQDHDLDSLAPDEFNTWVGDFLSHEPKGFLFGGTVGINYQVPGTRIVTGIEGDWAFANHDDRNSILDDEGCCQGELFSKTEINSIGTARVRAGYLADPNTLIYGTGGIAWASVKTSVGFDQEEGEWCEFGASEEDTNVGWTIGAGVEYKIDSIWSVKADYLYVDLADTEHRFNGFDETVTLTDDLTEHMVRVGVNATLF